MRHFKIVIPFTAVELLDLYTGHGAVKSWFTVDLDLPYSAGVAINTA